MNLNYVQSTGKLTLDDGTLVGKTITIKDGVITGFA